jgi:hypothetical protein
VDPPGEWVLLIEVVLWIHQVSGLSIEVVTHHILYPIPHTPYTVFTVLYTSLQVLTNDSCLLKVLIDCAIDRLCY